MKSELKDGFTKATKLSANLAYVFASLLLLVVSMFVHSILANTFKYFRTGHFQNPPNIGLVVIFFLIFISSMGLFFWSRRASRAAGKDRPVFSKKFVLVFSALFILLGTLYYI
jgi:small-conductance mechanosensitive channel